MLPTIDQLNVSINLIELHQRTFDYVKAYVAAYNVTDEELIESLFYSHLSTLVNETLRDIRGK